MSININSEASCRKAYLNYWTQGNTMRISAAEMGQICKAYQSKLELWKTSASVDENEYKIDDTDFLNAKNDGKNKAKDRTGYDGKNGDAKFSTARGAIEAGGAAVGAVGNIGTALSAKKVIGDVASGAAKEAAKNAAAKSAEEYVKKAGEEATQKATEEMTKKLGEEATSEAGKKAIEEAGKKAAEEATKEASEKAAEEAAKGAAGEAAKNVGRYFTYASAALGLANATRSWKGDPNKEGHDAAQEMQKVLTEDSVVLADNQGQLEDIQANIESLEDEAETTVGEAQGQIDTKAGEHSSYQTTYEALVTKANDGSITDGEKTFMLKLHKELGTTSEEMQEIADSTSENIVGINDDLGTYQEGFDSIAEVSAEVQGKMEFAASFDESSLTNCKAETIVQGINMASAGLTTVEAGVLLAKDIAAASGAGAFTFGIGAAGFTPLIIADGVALAAGGTAGVLSFKSMQREKQYANNIAAEIDTRNITNDIKTATDESYEEKLEFYAGTQEVVASQSLEIENDIEEPEALPTVKTPKEEPNKKEKK